MGKLIILQEETLSKSAAAEGVREEANRKWNGVTEQQECFQVIMK
jgi:hypothetical protein